MLWDFKPKDQITYGDIAIREATSAIDTALLLISHVFGITIPQDKLVWNIADKKRSLRQALIEKFGPQSQNLVAAVDAIFNAIGYELLSSYRNWVTHRGAPKLLSPFSGTWVVPIPKAILEGEKAYLEFHIRNHVSAFISDNIKIECFPFVPSVHAVINATIENPQTDVDIGGFRLGKGVGKIVIKNGRSVTGSLTENTDQYMANNPQSIELGNVMVAGEKLAKYSQGDYNHAITMVALFANEILIGQLDVEVQKLLEQSANSAL